MIEDAHDRGLLVHTWTFRSEQRRLASTFAGSPTREFLAYYDAGIDGVFTDSPDDACAARVQCCSAAIRGWSTASSAAGQKTRAAAVLTSHPELVFTTRRRWC